MENKTTPCGKCGSPANLIPPNGTPGVKVTSQKTGNQYMPFYKCENCQWTLSTDPNPRKFTRKPQGSPEQANSSLKEVMTRFDNLEKMVADVQTDLTDVLRRLP